MESFDFIKDLLQNIKEKSSDEDFFYLSQQIIYLCEENVKTLCNFEKKICNCSSISIEFCEKENLQNCRNYIVIEEYCPFLCNIFEKNNAIIFTEPIFQPYIKSSFNKNIRSLLNLIEKLSDIRDKCIVTISMFNYCMQFIQGLIDNHELANAIITKIEELVQDDVEFIKILDEFEIDYNIWLITFRKIVYKN